MSLKAQYIGTVLGAACGDALGSTLEFGWRRKHKKDYLRDLVGGGPFNWNPGQWTDDTDMAVAVGEGIVARPEAPIGDIGWRFLQWYKSGPKDIGGTCGVALRRAASGIPWPQCGSQTEQSAGNGALMRTYPVAMAYWRFPKHMLVNCLDIAAMTHVHADVRVTCSMLCWLLAVCYADETNPVSFIRHFDMSSIAAAGADQDAWHSLVKLLQKAVYQPRAKVKNSGYTVDTLVAAFWAFANTESLEECIIEAANLGGDSDSIATVAGALAGAAYGYGAIPDRWLEKLDGVPRLQSMAEGLYTLSEGRH